jgi:DNA-binding transcriptional MerR regulator
VNDHLKSYRGVEHDLDGLVRAAGDVLVASGVAQVDARVTELPDARAVRYYQTVGLLGKPLRYDGRQAVYGYRHLLELVAIKRLQAGGFSLAQIQRALAGATTERLEAALAEAVAEAPAGASDGALDGSRLAAAPPRSHPPRRLVAAEVAPGVIVTIDPDRVAAPGDVLAQIKRSLHRLAGAKE